MKKATKFLSVLLAVGLSTTTLSSCNFKIPTDKNAQTSIKNDVLQFTLTTKEVSKLRDTLDACKTLTLQGYSPRKIERLWADFETQFTHLKTQETIAQILYYADMKSSKALQNQTFASNASTEIYKAYMLAAQEIYQSDSPYRETFFQDWSVSEIDAMLAYSEKLTVLETKSNELITEYYTFNDNELLTKTDELYAQVLETNNAIAIEYGYDNYYEYAYDYIYHRDYETEQTETFRDNVATYLAPTLKTAYERFEQAQLALPLTSSYFVSLLLSNNYQDMETDYVQAYIDNCPDSMKYAFNDAFNNNNVLFTDSPRAREGAFCTILEEYGTPFCYFGPGYQTAFTVVHELGHYYAATYQDLFSASFDLCETQSQGNEWLFLRHLKNRLPENTYRAIEAYQQILSLCNIVVATIVDEFEYTLYTMETDDYTSLDFDKILEDICKNYGGVEYLSEFVNIQEYWKMVVVDSPVYYISYAVSGMAAINLNTVIQTNPSKGYDSYRYLIEQANSSEFLLSLSTADILNPFEKTSFTNLQTSIMKNNR